MSNNNWEQGSITIPSAAWAGLKAAVRDAYNSNQEKLYADAVRLYEAIIEAAKGKRNVNWRGAADEACAKLPKMETRWDLINTIFESKSQTADGRYQNPFSILGSAGRPNKPTKSQFPLATNRTSVFNLTHAAISFNDKTRVANWNVPENNHAVQDAHEDKVAQAFFAALNKIKWTASSGGSLYGNDEYNIDSGRECPGSGGSYVTQRFGRDKAEWDKATGRKSTMSRPALRVSGGAFAPFGSPYY